jgi:CRP/FNR family transcriptional regulator, cyclic AMP receptor protein
MIAAMTDADVNALREVPLFSSLDDRALKQLSMMFQDDVFAPGHEIAAEGRKGLDFFFLIESGTASVSRGGEVINTLGPGDWFGELALISRGPRTATVTATDELRCKTLASFQFRPFVKEHADVAWGMLELLVERLRGAERR